MAEKTPRLKPHTIIDVAAIGERYYHPPRADRQPLNPDQQRMAGQLSLQEAHYEDPRDLAEVMELIDNGPEPQGPDIPPLAA